MESGFHRGNQDAVCHTQRQHRPRCVYSQDLGPRRQSARCLDQLQLAAGDQIAQAGALDRAAVRIVARLGAGRRQAKRERTHDQQEREAMMLRRAPRHRIQYARTRTRTHTHASQRTAESAARLKRSRDNAHRCRAASSPWRRWTNSACPATERVTIIPPRSDVTPRRCRVQNKLPRLHPRKRYDLRTMMTPTAGRLQLRAQRHLATRPKWWPTRL